MRVTIIVTLTVFIGGFIIHVIVHPSSSSSQLHTIVNVENSYLHIITDRLNLAVGCWSDLGFECQYIMSKQVQVIHFIKRKGRDLSLRVWVAAEDRG